MPERRSEERPGAPDRRTFPRPPLWLNLLLLFLGVAAVLWGRHHREQVSQRFAHVIAREAHTPADVKRAKDELAEMDLTRESLQQQLQGRTEFVNSLKSENFYLSIDSQQKKLRFYYGDTVLREADVEIGETRNVTSGGRTWTFMPAKGAFHVEAKVADHVWEVPEWVYAMNGEAVPQQRPRVEGGLGRYVIFLPNGYVIHSPPVEGSPLTGPKPGSFMVPEADLRAIWARIHKDKTQVYIF